MRVGCLGNTDSLKEWQEFFQKRRISLEPVADGKKVGYDVILCEKGFPFSKPIVHFQKCSFAFFYFSKDETDNKFSFYDLKGNKVGFSAQEDIWKYIEKKVWENWQIRYLGISQFADSLAHDINNILTVIMGYSQMFSMQKLPENLTRWSEAIYRGGNHLKEMMDYLLNFGRDGLGEKEEINWKATLEKFNFPTNIFPNIKGDKELFELFVKELRKFLDSNSDFYLSILEVSDLPKNVYFFGKEFSAAVGFEIKIPLNGYISLFDFFPLLSKERDLTLPLSVVRRHAGGFLLQGDKLIFCFPLEG
jgi:hypothetical protein